MVFHVFGDAHNCNEDDGVCVTDDILVDALKRTNEDFQGLNTLDGPIDPAFAAIRGNLNIEFVLAKTDPNGNMTTGIVRHGDEKGHGNGGDNAAVQDNAWDNFKYMNIYIVNDLYDNGKLNSSGVAWYPNKSMSDEGLARVVYNGSYIGKNSNENFRSILTHEFGHWLNLAHTFDTTSCHAPGAAFCASEGDNVCDTPQMVNSSLRNNAPNCLGEPTNTENFMHYTNNYAMFTEQQVQRMTAALYHPSRETLWSDDNLAATGLSGYVGREAPEWDGKSGIPQRPEGEILLEQTDLSAAKDDITRFEFSVPEGTKAVTVFLEGFDEDPDIYMSHGEEPQLDEGGNWTQDVVSFNGVGQNEAMNVLTPKSTGKYHVAIHAFTAYSNAKLSVVAVDDPTTCGNCERVLIHEEKHLAAARGSEPKVLSIEVPDKANYVSVEMPPGYQGDPDIHVNHNSVPVVDSADCLPWRAPGVREICEFRGENVGGTYNILINPYRDYSNVALTVHYGYVDADSGGENASPTAKAGRAYNGVEGTAIEFSSEGSSDIDGQVSSFAWDFGDGNTSTDAQPSHSYAKYGQYTATLTVTDDDGATDSFQSNVLVGRQNEYCAVTADNNNDHIQNVKLADLDNASHGASSNGYQDFTALSATVLVGSNEITLMGAGPLSGLPTENWTVWVDYNGNNDFSDEGEMITQFSAKGVATQSFEVPAELKGLTTTMRVAMRYDEHAQSFCGSLGEGEFEDYTLRVNSDPVVSINGSYSGNVNEAISFSSAGSMDNEGDLASYSWSFGDGNTSSEANPSHSYDASGSYTATLTVTDSNGVSVSQQTSVSVSAAKAPSVPSSSSGGSLGIFGGLMLLMFGARRRQ